MRSGQEAGSAAAGRLLAELLVNQPAYRARWRRRVKRDRGAGIHQAAVCDVIAGYLRGSDDPDLAMLTARELKDRVSRALGGAALTAETLAWFIDAFDMAEVHQAGLWDAFGAGPGAPVELMPNERTNEAGHPWRTVALQEHHYLGRDGVPVSHHTRHVLVALQDNVDRYPFTFDTSEASVEVVRGGVAQPLRPAGHGFHTVDIVYDEPLARGELASFEYRVLFHYSVPPPPVFRRQVRRRLSSLLVRVSFHPEKLPAGVWWAEWSDPEPHGVILRQEPARLRVGNVVYQYLEDLEDVVVGFHWEW
jgi:hypothetical protein